LKTKPIEANWEAGRACGRLGTRKDRSSPTQRLRMAGATIIVLHHIPKSGRDKSRGSTAIEAGVDVALNLKVNRKPKPPTITLECFKQRGMEEFAITIRPDFEHGQFEVVSDSSIPESDKMIEKLKALISAEPGLCQKDLIERSKLSQRAAAITLTAGENIHWKITKPSRKKKLHYPMDDKS
jgi:hypothetical protein